MDITSIVTTLFHGNQLKRTARTGWVQRGVPQAEDVAAHSYGVVFATMILAQLIEPPIDLGRALAMAALHDLPEGLTTDIPTPAWRFLPPGIKTDVERGAMQEILADAPFASQFMDVWEELHAAETAELAQAAGFAIVEQFRSDGKEGNLSLYTVLTPTLPMLQS